MALTQADSQANFVIPAKAGIHFQVVEIKVVPGFCRDDGTKPVPFEYWPTFNGTCIPLLFSNLRPVHWAPQLGFNVSCEFVQNCLPTLPLYVRVSL